MAPIEVVGIGAVGSQFQGAFELLLGGDPVEVVDCRDVGEHAVRLAEPRVERQRLRAGVSGSGVVLVRPQRAGFGELRISHGEGGVRQGVGGVLGDCLLEVFDPLATPFRGVAQVTVSALQIQLVGLQIAGGLMVEPGLLIGRQFRLERGRDLQRHVRLDREDIREPTVVRLDPEVSVRFCVDELCHDPHPIAGAPHTTLEQRRDLESRPDLPEALLPLLEGHH